MGGLSWSKGNCITRALHTIMQYNMTALSISGQNFGANLKIQRLFKFYSQLFTVFKFLISCIMMLCIIYQVVN